jgi:hypothetical protein
MPGSHAHQGPAGSARTDGDGTRPDAVIKACIEALARLLESGELGGGQVADARDDRVYLDAKLWV